MEYRRSKCASESGWLTAPQLHVGVGDLVAHHELVLGRTPGELAGADHERTAAGEGPFPALDRMLQQLRGAQVPVRDVEIAESLLFETVAAGPDPRVRDLLVFGQHRISFPIRARARIVELSHEPACLGMCPRVRIVGTDAATPRSSNSRSNGLKYQTLTKSGVTVMFATLPQHLREYAILQVAVSNGSKAPYVIRPEDFTFVRLDGVGAARLPGARSWSACWSKGQRQRRDQAGHQLRELDLRQSAPEIHQRLRAAPPERPRHGVGEARRPRPRPARSPWCRPN